MAAKHKSHGNHSTGRTGTESRVKSTGSDYPDNRFSGGGPWNQGLTHYTGNEHSKTLYSPTSTPEGCDLPLHHDYDELWERGK
jgi:hypothetical protein